MARTVETAAAPERTPGSGEQKETGRLEAFSDGVFAIAITLLVLTIQIPPLPPSHPRPGDPVPGDLAGRLWNSWPMFAAYLISFAFILIMWVNHHNLFTVIKRIDHTFLLLNGLLLMFVTLVPFPTGLLATYLRDGNVKDERVAALVANGTYVLIALAFNLLWRYASHNGRLLDRNVDERFVAEVNQRYQFGPLLYLGCCALVFVTDYGVYVSLLANATLAVYFALPSNVDRQMRDMRAKDRPSINTPSKPLQ